MGTDDQIDVFQLEPTLWGNGFKSHPRICRYVTAFVF